MESPHIHKLPDEVLGQILSHFSQGEIITGVLPVCRRWQAVAQTEVLSRGLQFCYNAVPTEEALHLIRAIPNLRSLQLIYRPDTVQLLQAAGSRCTELRRLDVEDWNNDSALTAALGSVFRSCEQLTSLNSLCGGGNCVNGLQLCRELGPALPNLRRLTILCCTWFGPEELDAVIDSCPQMQQFRTFCLCSDAQISRLAQRWGSSLQVLYLWASELTDAGVAALDGCSQLRSLELDCWRSPGAGLLQLATLAQLERLTLHGCCFRVRPKNIQQFFSQSRSACQLRKIDLNGCSRVDDRVLTALAAACRNVEDVNVAFCKRVTAAGVRELLRGSRQLLRLDVMYTDPSVLEVLPEIPQLAPQLRQLTLDSKLLSSRPEVVSSVQAQMPGLKLN